MGIPSPAVAQAPFIEEIRWEGLRRIPRDTMNARIISRKGDPYDLQTLQRDLHAAWNTSYFEDVRLEVEDGDEPGGKIIWFVVKERPLIRRIRYDGKKSVTKSDILERFRERRVGLTVESQYDPTRVRRAEVELKNLLAERGRSFAKVTHIARRVPPNALILTFVIEEGPKVKVGKINFRGNRRFSDRKLVRTMKGTRPIGIPPWWYFIRKTYNRDRVNIDVGSLRERYQEHGYYRVVVHEPETRVRDTQPWLPLRLFPFWFKDGKAMDLRITVEEGGRYRMGDIKIQSATGDEKDLFFNPRFLEAAFPLKKGDIFNVTVIREALEEYGKLYSGVGYVNFNPIADTDVDDDARVVNLTLDFETGKQFYVHRIEFSGNTTTRDKVIRRELLLEEGMVFDSRRWETSILRLNQLGFFQELSPENADVRRDAEKGRVELSLKVKEKGKNSIGFSGGASGIVGSFVGLSYTTNNFLGLGETLSVNTQWGDRSTSFVFGFTEPYLFDRPLQTGFTFTIRQFEFDQARESGIARGRQLDISDELSSRLLNYEQDSIGFNIFGSYPLRKWSFARIGLTYGYDTSDITCSSEACENLFGTINFRGLEGPNTLQGIRSSRLGGSISYNTTNHPIFATQGTSLFISTTLEGGILGGNQKSIRPVVEYRHYQPMFHRRHTLAIRVLGSFISGYGGRVPSPFNRFYIGGENTIRGFDTQSITPIAFQPTRQQVPAFYLDPTRPDPNGNPSLQTTVVDVLVPNFTFPGGDTQLLANVEYRVPIVGFVTLAAFLDVGLNTVLRRSQLRLRQGALENLRSAFPSADIPDNLALVPGTNRKVRSSAGLELTINLPILQVPFRFYYAYNVSRFDGTLAQAASIIQEADGFPLPPGVLERQIIPALRFNPVFSGRTLPFVEPLKVFRFALSRTF